MGDGIFVGQVKLTSGKLPRMKTSPEDIDVLLVGGGSIIAPAGIRGVANIYRPPFYSVANAVGAAMARGRFYNWCRS